MRTIWKYPLKLDNEQTVEMPEGAEIVKLDVQRGDVQVWALVDTGVVAQPRHFAIRGTGHPIPEGASYLGSVQDAPFVWHVFEVPNHPTPGPSGAAERG